MHPIFRYEHAIVERVSSPMGTKALAREGARRVFRAVSYGYTDEGAAMRLLSSLTELEPLPWLERPVEWIKTPTMAAAQEGPHGPKLVSLLCSVGCGPQPATFG